MRHVCARIGKCDWNISVAATTHGTLRAAAGLLGHHLDQVVVLERELRAVRAHCLARTHLLRRGVVRHVVAVNHEPNRRALHALNMNG